jgi:hypothetical protein
MLPWALAFVKSCSVAEDNMMAVMVVEEAEEEGFPMEPGSIAFLVWNETVRH